MGFDFKIWPVVLVFGLVCAVGGWALIEGICWLIKHVSITWGA